MDMEPFSAICPCFPQVSGRQNPQKNVVFSTCLSDRLHVDVTIFPCRKIMVATSAWRSKKQCARCNHVFPSKKRCFFKVSERPVTCRCNRSGFQEKQVRRGPMVFAEVAFQEKQVRRGPMVFRKQVRRSPMVFRWPLTWTWNRSRRHVLAFRR